MRNRVLLLSLLAAGACLNKQPTPAVFEIPESFRGWAVIRFSDPSCAAVPKIDGKWHVRLDADGRLCTSSPLTSNWRSDEYYIIGEERRRVKLVGASSRGEVRNHVNGRCAVSDNPPVQFQKFFVGSAEHFRTATNPKMEGCDPSSEFRKSR
jgi:hypothetical protein